MKYLGVDYGTKRIGLAIASSETSPVPFKTLQISDLRLQISELLHLINEEQIDIVVVGNPRAMQGSDKTAIEQEVDGFVLNLQSEIKSLKLKTLVFMEDERLSSKGADALGKEFGQSGQRDAVAAMLILESYLGRIKK